MSHSVRWTKWSLRRLDEIGTFIAQYNPTAAARMVEGIVESVEILREHPAAGRPGRIFGTRELVVSGTKYIVAYRVFDHDIETLTVQHGSQNWPGSL